MVYDPYVGICECGTSRQVCRLSRLTSCDIGLSVLQVVKSAGDSTSDVTSISSFNSDGNDKTMIVKTNRNPMLIHSRWYELPLGTCRSGDLSAAPNNGE